MPVFVCMTNQMVSMVSLKTTEAPTLYCLQLKALSCGHAHASCTTSVYVTNLPTFLGIIHKLLFCLYAITACELQNEVLAMLCWCLVK